MGRARRHGAPLVLRPVCIRALWRGRDLVVRLRVGRVLGLGAWVGAARVEAAALLPCPHLDDDVCDDNTKLFGGCTCGATTRPLGRVGGCSAPAMPGHSCQILCKAYFDRLNGLFLQEQSSTHAHQRLSSRPFVCANTVLCVQSNFCLGCRPVRSKLVGRPDESRADGMRGANQLG